MQTSRLPDMPGGEASSKRLATAGEFEEEQHG